MQDVDRGGQGALLERDRELAALDTLIREAAAGVGGTLQVEAAAGLGKTRLLGEATARGLSGGLTVLSARGGELERDFGFGLIRQLFEPTLVRADDTERRRLFAGAAGHAEPVFGATEPETGADPTHAVLHGLYWLLANLAERGPLLLAIDDLHWADIPSLRFLVYLAPRLDGLPVALLLATRVGDEPAEPELVRRLALDARGPTLRPRPLSEESARQLVRAGLGEDAGPELSLACHEATAGNPFLLSELIAELQADGLPPAEISAETVRALGPERIAAGLLLRVGRIDPRATTLARAVAVLGTAADVEVAATVAGISPADARDLARSMASAAVLEVGEPLRFVHPIARTAIYDELGEATRAELHREAARVLADRGAKAETIAMHLLATDPAGELRSVETLTAAGSSALSGGAPETAASYLRRALAEPAPEPNRAALLRLLGLAELGSGNREGVDFLRAAVEATPGGPARAEVTQTLAGIVGPQGDFEGAVQLLDVAAEELNPSEPELRGRLEAIAASFGRLIPETRARSCERARGFAADLTSDADSSPAACAKLAALAFQRGLDSGSAEEAAGLAERAFGSGALFELGPEASPIYDGLFSLIVAERFAEAERHCARALDDARAAVAIPGIILASSFRSFIALRRGDVTRAEGEARAAVDIARQTGFALGAAAMASGWLIEALIERGDLTAAEQTLEATGFSGEIPDSLLLNYLLKARGRLRIAAGDADGGLADLRTRRDRDASAELSRNPIMSEHLDSTLCEELARRGEFTEAREIAEEQLAIAQAWGTPRATGVALRTLGMVRGDEEGIPLLTEAVSTFESSEGRLEHARALVELGAALGRQRRTRDARDRLAEGMDMAHSCGATALVDRALRELVAVGARPRRPALSGIAALTPSERRVSEMAAEGMTNKEIAQALFVTLRTVEMHLSNAYGKLGISSRHDLPRALSG